MSRFKPEQKTAFKKANAGSLDNGSYVGLLADSSEKMTQGGDLRLNLIYEVVSPEPFAGAKYVHSIPMDKPQLYPMLKAILYKFGVDTKTVELEEVQQRMLERVGMEVQFEIYQNGKYQNCNVVTALYPNESDKKPNLEEDDDIKF